MIVATVALLVRPSRRNPLEMGMGNGTIVTLNCRTYLKQMRPSPEARPCDGPGP